MRSRRTGTCRSSAVPRVLMGGVSFGGCCGAVVLGGWVRGGCLRGGGRAGRVVSARWAPAVRSPTAPRGAARHRGSCPGTRSGWRPGHRGVGRWLSEEAGDHLLGLVGEGLLGAVQV